MVFVVDQVYLMNVVFVKDLVNLQEIVIALVMLMIALDNVVE